MLSVTLLFFSTVAGTFAYFTVEKKTDSGLSTAKVAGTIVETYQQAQKNIQPGDTVQKIVHVRNDGTADMLVRIKIEKVWKNGENVTTLSTKNIIPAFNLDRWIDGGDGYYYYCGILKAGETTQRALFDSFTVNAAETGNEYQGKTANIDVTMETIQATERALQTWGKTYAQLRITAPGKQEGTTSYVSFINAQTGFQCKPDSGNLFSAFQQLLPGEGRTQKIEVRNAYTSPVEIQFRAEAAPQTAATPEKLALIDRLLREHAVIKITEAGRTLYQGPAWGNYTTQGSAPDTIKNNISLGRFDPQQARTLTVELQLNAQTGNEYQELLGMVRWVFVANENLSPATPTPTVQPTPTPTTWPTKPPSGWEPKPDAPKTGDDSMLTWLIAEFTIAATVMTLLIVKYKKLAQYSNKKDAVR